MFEKIVLRSSETGLALSLGEIAEALLFYQNVHLVLDMGSLASLISSFGANELLALVERKRLTAVYAEDFLATFSTSTRTLQCHSFATGVITGKVNQSGVLRSRRDRLQNTLERSKLSREEARRVASRFCDQISIVRYSSDHFVKDGIHRSASNDLNDPSYVTAAVKLVLKDQVGFESFAENLKGSSGLSVGKS